MIVDPKKCLSLKSDHFSPECDHSPQLVNISPKELIHPKCVVPELPVSAMPKTSLGKSWIWNKSRFQVQSWTYSWNIFGSATFHVHLRSLLYKEQTFVLVLQLSLIKEWMWGLMILQSILFWKHILYSYEMVTYYTLY